MRPSSSRYIVVAHKEHHYVLVSVLALLLTFFLAICPLQAWAEGTDDSSQQQTSTGQESQNPESEDQAQESDSDQGSDEGQNSDSSGNKVYVNQLSDSSFLYETSIADLAQADSYYEGQTVLVKGEVVGDRVSDDMDKDGCWITLQDSEATPSVIAVFMTKDQASVIDTFGKYGVIGTQLQVRGIYHLECAEHQGMSDIHADEVTALKKGYEQEPAPSTRVLVIAIVACAFGAALVAAFYIKRERML